MKQYFFFRLGRLILFYLNKIDNGLRISKNVLLKYEFYVYMNNDNTVLLLSM